MSCIFKQMKSYINILYQLTTRIPRRLVMISMRHLGNLPCCKYLIRVFVAPITFIGIMLSLHIITKQQKVLLNGMRYQRLDSLRKRLIAKTSKEKKNLL